MSCRTYIAALWSGMLLTLAQPVQAKFNLLFTTEDKLPNSLINIVTEDHEEMIWVATEDGLCRFDGSQFITYTHDETNPNSLRNNIIRTVFTDSRGHVLVATNGGVQCYRRATDDFTPVIFNTDEGIDEGNVNELVELPNGDVVAAGNSTFSIRFDEHDQPMAVANAFTAKHQMTNQACVDLDGRLWVADFEHGLYYLDHNNNVKLVPVANPHKAGYNCVRSGPDGNIYLGGMECGLFRYHPKTGAFEELTGSADNWQVRDLRTIAGTMKMYVCTDGDGVKQLDCLTGRIEQVSFDDVQIDAATQKVHSIMTSRHGDLWMSLYQKGVFVVAHTPLEFHYYGPKSLQHNCVGERCITSICRSNDGTLWVATDNGGLYGVSREGRTVAHIDCLSHGGTLPSSLMGLFNDSRGRMWFGSYRQGGGMVNLKDGSAFFVPIEGEGVHPVNVYDYAEDKRGQIWAGSMGQGILRYDEQKRCFMKVETYYPCNWTGVLRYDAKHDCLYAGTYDGMVVIDLTQKPYVCKQFMPHYVIYSITRCSDRELCLCTNLGMVIIDGTTGESITYTVADGLPNNNTYAAQVDSEGNLWVSGSAGLSKFNMQQRTFTNYSAQDGMQSSEFYKNTSWRDEDGTLWFGGTSGITFFNPRNIQRQEEAFTARVVGLTTDQRRIIPDAEGCYRLDNDVHSFSIELGARPILRTRTVNYRYSLDGDRWQTLPSMVNTISFSHISSGSHTFRYQILDEMGESPVEELRIDIGYPWYEQWWANLIWLTLLLLLLFLLYRHTQRIRNEKKLLRAQERETAINEAKLQFFMNIAHDFRTPMTLVVSPLQKLMSTDKDAQRQHAYQLMNRNANRVLILINELMDLRKIDQAQMQLQCQQFLPGVLIHEMCESMSDMIENRQLSLTIEDHCPEGRRVWIDRDCFEKILLNLLSNAIKYTPKGGKIDVACVLRDRLEVSVTDTGIGINAQDREHIFERFYQVRHQHNSMGTGIGLNLVQAMVQLHHGEIRVEDNPAGQGTRFTFLLPAEDTAYTEAEKYKEPETKSPELVQELTPVEILRNTMQEDTGSEADHKQKVRRRILVVDDDDEVRNYLVQELNAKYRVVDCQNGQEALQRLQSDENYDLVLSDVMMPEMDGIELCHRIRANVLLNHLPVILLTAKATDDDQLRSLEVGANAFIAKPFNMEIVLKTVENLLSAQTRLRSSFSGQQLPVDKVETPELQSPDERLLERILKVVNDNLSNPELTSEDIAREVGLSRVHLYRKLKELTNQSARNYIRNIRLVKAAELLSQKKMAVAEVAYQVGFANPNNFATAFKEMYGMTPTAYMEKKSN